MENKQVKTRPVRVIGRRVLIEQKITEKKSNILDNTGEKGKSQMECIETILQIGPECPEGVIAVGEHPVFNNHVQYQAMKQVFKEETKTHVKMTVHVIVYFDDIVAIEEIEPEVIIDQEV